MQLTQRVLILLAILSGPLPSMATERNENRKAVERSLILLQASAAGYTDQRECFSCHHQALPSMAIALAQQRGLVSDRKKVQWQSEFTAAFFLARKEELPVGKGVPGGPYTAAYAAVQLAADRAQMPDAVQLLTRYLLKTEEGQGGWRIRTHRPPIEDSDLTATALSVAALRLDPAVKQNQQSGAVIRRARDWLRNQDPSTTEDRVFQLLGLAWSWRGGGESLSLGWDQLFSRPGRVSDALFATRAEQLLELQNSDGGWSQGDDLSSDAYATGQVLVALVGTGYLPVAHRSIRRGLTFLRQTQLDDGSWYVESRSKPFQKQFESGFPHGKNQFISIAASSWATMALSLSLPLRREPARP